MPKITLNLEDTILEALKHLVWNILEGDLMDIVRFLECAESFDA